MNSDQISCTSSFKPLILEYPPELHIKRDRSCTKMQNGSFVRYNSLRR